MPENAGKLAPLALESPVPVVKRSCEKLKSITSGARRAQGDSGPTRPLHLVECALRTRFHQRIRTRDRSE